MKTITLRDGRLLAYECYGDKDNGYPVIFSHGLSDSRLLRHYDDVLTAKELGVYWIAIDQPGVGGSTNTNGGERTLLNYAKDVEELVNQLHIQQFAVTGHSGGGPHALAIAAYLKQRVTNVVLAAPAPPLDDTTCPDVMEPLGFAIKFLVWFCRWFPFLVNAVCKVIAWYANRNLQRYVELCATSDRTNGNPETFLGNPKQTQIFQKSFEAGFAQGSAGILGMLQVVMLEPQWGFDIRKDVQQPVHFFMSDLDSVIPPKCGTIMANCMGPNATVKTWKNAGHYSFVDRNCWIDFLTTAATAKAGASAGSKEEGTRDDDKK